MAFHTTSLEEHSTIHQAARDGDTDSVRYHIHKWLKKRWKLNKLDKQELSALHYAVRYGHYEVVLLLLNSGADVHCVGHDGAQPIHIAARHGKISPAPALSDIPNTTTIRIRSDENINRVPKTDREEGYDNDGITLSRLIPVLDEEQSILSALLQYGADPNAKDAYGQTPLHYASLKGNLMMTEILLQGGAEVEQRDKSRATSLHAACGSGHTNVVKRLLKAGASLAVMDDENMTPFHYAVSGGHIQVIQTIFECIQEHGLKSSVESLLSEQDRHGQTGLHLAVENGHFEIAGLLLQKGAGANQVCTGHVTPLHIAAAAGRLDLITLLVAHGAKIDKRNANGETALHKAANFNRTDAVTFLLSRGSNINAFDEDNATPLIVAASNGHAEVADILLKRGAALHVKDAAEKSAIYWAAAENSLSTLKVLLDDPRSKPLMNDCERYENTPLHVAAENGYLGIVRLLLLYKADMTASNDEDHTACHVAAKNGRVRVVKELLMQQQSFVNDVDEFGNTPLHLAAIHGHADVIDVLVEFGASVNARNVNMWTPLDCAAAEGHLLAAKYLLDRDSPLDPLDRCKTTPLHLASREGHLEVVKLLLEREADVTLTDADKKNCLDMAIESGHEDIALAILNHKDWILALKNRKVDGGVVTTPFRKMIHKLPEVAFTVCNLLMKLSKDIPMNHPDFRVTFRYDILDDTYCDWSTSDDVESVKDQSSDVVSLLSTHITKEYRLKQLEKKSNHPLHIMALNKREKLLGHPLVRSLLEEKWRGFGRYIYYSKLSLYVVFLFFLTAYVVTSTPLIPMYVHVNGTQVCQTSGKSLDTLTTKIFVKAGKYIVLALAGLQLLMEIVQAASRRLEYISFENLIEWFIFVMAIIFVADTVADSNFFIDMCSITHLSIGAVTIFLAWLDLLLFLRKFPKHGIYVVMFTDILNTFIQFFVTFSLFIIAFALGFYVLLHRQLTAFDGAGKSLLKIMVMMIGEFDFDNIFNDGRSDKPPVITWLLFVVFVIVMTIILMNLLVGLAVDDIKAVQDQAKLNRLRMQVDLVLDVEKVLPRSIRRRLAVTQESIYPNRESAFRRYWRPHPVTIEEIQKALNPQRAVVELVQQQTSSLDENVRELRGDVSLMQEKLVTLEKMLGALLANHQIEEESP